MTKLSVMSRNFYLAMLASLSVSAIWFAMMATSSSGFFFPYQPKIPNVLIKKDE
jgi:cyclic lactone autoinducer peptide